MAIRMCPYVLTYHGVPNCGITDLIRSGELEGKASQYLDGHDRRSPAVALTNARSYALQRLYLRAADVVVTVSEFSSTELIRFLELPPQKITVTYEAADQTFHETVTDRALSDAKHQYHLRDTFLLFVGGFNLHMNVGTLLRVFAQLKMERSDPGLVLVGGTDVEIGDTLAALRFPHHDVLCVERIADHELRALQ